MSAGEELEAALQRGWCFDELEVYADHLLAKNDPRGDIVALDLSPRPEQATWLQRRRSAIGAWIGNALAARAAHLIQHGFLHELRDGMYPRELLESPAGRYLRGYTTWGRARVLASLERIASRPRPWLTRLTIAYYGSVKLPDALVRSLIKATPHLEDVCIYGDAPFAAFPHPAVKRARLGTRCYEIEIDAPKTRVDVPEYCPGPRIANDDLELLLDLVELAPDCNQLYTYGQDFDEPLPALIARLAAAKLVELDGPVVRNVAPELYIGGRSSGLQAMPGFRGWAYFERGELYLGMQTHGELLRSCLEQLPVSARVADVIAEYHNMWMRSSSTTYSPERTARLREAFVALLELRAMWPVDIATPDRWDEIEQLVTGLDSEGGVRFSRAYYYYG